jgi:3,4-dihydroxy 2-butanone 4-phosphate synthase/GTP cyclohydrolase II
MFEETYAIRPGTAIRPVREMRLDMSENLTKQAEALIPTPWGNFRMAAYSSDPEDWMPHLALIAENTDFEKPVLVRVHSECITGDMFGSKRCDCGEQLSYALARIAREGGILLYLRQEGRGIGIINKLKAYNLQDLGLNTVDANLHLGLEVDARHYDIAIAMLDDLGIESIKLLTNNPEKIEAFEDSSVTVIERAPIVMEPNADNLDYLRTKQEILGHLFKL